MAVMSKNAINVRSKVQDLNAPVLLVLPFIRDSLGGFSAYER
jgi:hypothetical protein